MLMNLKLIIIVIIAEKNAETNIYRNVFGIHNLLMNDLYRFAKLSTKLLFKQ